MDWAGWAVFGLAATAALTSILIGAQLAGWTRLDLPLLLGTLVLEDPDHARAAGFLAHLGAGQVFALLYASGFAVLGEASWGLGALFGLLHGGVALTAIIPLFWPGILTTFTVLAFYLIGDGLRDALDPMLRNKR